MTSRIITFLSFPLFMATFLLIKSGFSNNMPHAQVIPDEIQAIFKKNIYRDAIWGFRVSDLDTGEVIYDVMPEYRFLIGSVRKLFSIGLLMNTLGPDYHFTTPVYAQGEITHGILDGNLILVASGDLTMGGRMNPDGTLAVSDFDHNEANTLGNAELTQPDPLAGYTLLAREIASSGITQIRGDVIIDDRLFVPFNFRDEFNVSPIFVNDDTIDISISPTPPGTPASVFVRPLSKAFDVNSNLISVTTGEKLELELNPEFPKCIGQKNCVGMITGKLPMDLSPPLTHSFPLIQTFRITEPSNYARTVFIEALQKAGVSVLANTVDPNPTAKLPDRGSYLPQHQVAALYSPPYSEFARFILKVSYNLGADTSLVLFGLTQDVNTMESSLIEERKKLIQEYGISGETFHFTDGSGGGLAQATMGAISQLLAKMEKSRYFPEYFNALPTLGRDGSLNFITDFEADPTLAGAKGNVHAKTGTYVEGKSDGPWLRAQALAGYINTKRGKHLEFVLAVNEVGNLKDLSEVLKIFQDQGTISAFLWRNF